MLPHHLLQTGGIQVTINYVISLHAFGCKGTVHAAYWSQQLPTEFLWRLTLAAAPVPALQQMFLFDCASYMRQQHLLHRSQERGVAQLMQGHRS